MQHHGAPTRLLDFSWSPYVAAFFALEAATRDSAVWAVNSGNLQSYAFGHTGENRAPSRSTRCSAASGLRGRTQWFSGNPTSRTNG